MNKIVISIYSLYNYTTVEIRQNEKSAMTIGRTCGFPLLLILKCLFKLKIRRKSWNSIQY